MRVKVINLDRRPDRYVKFKENAKNILDNYERVSAVDGKDLKITVDLMHLFRYNNFNWRAPVMGCSLSHYNIWKELVASDDEYFMVLEDDIIFTENFNKYKEELLNNLNNFNKSLLFIGYTVLHPENYNENVSSIEIQKIHNKKEYAGSFGYIIHRDHAQKLLNDIQQHGMRDPIDMFILSYDNTYITNPPLIISDAFLKREDSETDSDIHYDIFSIFDDYVFLEGSDSFGHDIDTCHTSFDELAQRANDNDDCVAFNTLGYIKNKLCNPENLGRIPVYHLKFQGLYIKREKIPKEYLEYLDKNSEYSLGILSRIKYKS